MDPTERDFRKKRRALLRSQWHLAAKDVDVADLRERMGITQTQFAHRFGFSLATLRHWEAGERKPRGAARVLLNILAVRPDVVLQVLRRNRFVDNDLLPDPESRRRKKLPHPDD